MQWSPGRGVDGRSCVGQLKGVTLRGRHRVEQQTLANGRSGYREEVSVPCRRRRCRGHRDDLVTWINRRGEFPRTSRQYIRAYLPVPRFSPVGRPTHPPRRSSSRAETVCVKHSAVETIAGRLVDRPSVERRGLVHYRSARRQQDGEEHAVRRPAELRRGAASNPSGGILHGKGALAAPMLNSREIERAGERRARGSNGARSASHLFGPASTYARAVDHLRLGTAEHTRPHVVRESAELSPEALL